MRKSTPRLRHALREQVLAAGFFLAALLAGGAEPGPSRYVEGELLVQFLGGPRGEPAAQAQRALRHKVKRHFDRVGWQHVQLPAGLTVTGALSRYQQHPSVLAAEPNYLCRLVLACTNTTVIPDDPLFGQQWALPKIGATNAWALTTGLSNVVVAVLDTGIKYDHEDLAPNMWHNPDEIPGNGIDDDTNGYVDDVFGIDAVSPDSDPKDQLIGLTYHGTACASIIGARGNNHLGVAGVTSPVQLMALRIAAESNYVASAWVVECINYVLTMKSRGVNVRVTSNSYGLDANPGQAVRDAFERLGQAGVLSVFAAMNEKVDLDVTCYVYPQCYRLPGIINVAASDGDDILASFSNYGATNVDLAAPGVNICVAGGDAAYYTNSYGDFTGTSAACPQVAGAAALLAAAYPFATLEQIKTALLESVDPKPGLSNLMVANGRLNVGKAIRHPILTSNAPPFIICPPQSQTNGQGDGVTFCVTATGTNLSYQWQFNGTNMTNDVRISGTTDGTLSICNAQTNDAGGYTVVVSNALDVATSATATLTVAICPVILVQPQSRQVFDSTNVLLTALAAGAAPLNYQWQRSGVNIPNATDPTLALPNACPRDSDAYQVVLSNACNVVTSEVATVTVLGRPWIVAQPQSQTVTQGANVTLSVTVTNCASLPIRVAWRHYSTTQGLVVVSNGFAASTNLLNIQPAAAGIWTVRITNAATAGGLSLAGSNAYLTVVMPPTNQTVCAGDSVRFTATAAGTNLSYQWQFNGTNLTNGGRISGATTTNLTFSNVLPSDAGEYTFVVTNPARDATGFPARLDVLPRQPTVCLVSCPDPPLQLCLEICWPDDDLNCFVQWKGNLGEPWQPWNGAILVEPCRKCVRIPVNQDMRFFRLKCGSTRGP